MSENPEIFSASVRILPFFILPVFIQILPFLTLPASPAPHQQDNSRRKSKDTDELGRGKIPNASPDQIPAEKLQDKTSGAVEDQIARPHLTVCFFSFCDRQKH